MSSCIVHFRFPFCVLDLTHWLDENYSIYKELERRDMSEEHGQHIPLYNPFRIFYAHFLPLSS